MSSSSKELALRTAKLATEKKAEDVVLLEIGKVSLIADYFLICTGSNLIQVRSICDYIVEKLKEAKIPLLHIEGYDSAKWVLLDYGILVIHVFQPVERQNYNLERLWGNAPKIEAMVL